MQTSPLARRALVAAALTTLVACSDLEPEPTPSISEMRTHHQPLQAFCTVNVIGYGTVDMETDYLPRVVRCENGAAPLEALKAQAVAARGYAYYRMDDTGDINPDTSDQKYNCAGDPSPIHYQAVAETSGQYVEYNNTIVAAFYVAGAIPGDRDTCVAVAGDNDYSSTERFVTYNAGRAWSSPCDQTVSDTFTCDDPIPAGCEPPPACQTTLGFRARSFDKNRGCKSQNGATCLAEKGWNHEQILRFYYGEDIGLPIATGACVQPAQECEIIIGDGETIIDQSDTPCFRGGCAEGSTWETASEGYGGSHIYTYAWDQGVDCSGRWNLEVAEARAYDVEIYVDTTAPLSESAPYRIRHAGAEDVVVVNQAANTGQWTSLGRFDFAAGGDQWIELVDDTGEPYTGTSGKRIAFDAVKLIAVVEAPEPSEDTGPADTSTGEDTSPADTSTGEDTSPAEDTAPAPDTGEDTSTAPDTDAGEDASTGADSTGGADIGTLASRGESGCACALRAPTPGSSPRAPLLALLLTLGGVLVRRRR